MSYHVTFFGPEPSRAWLTENHVRKFQGNETKENLGRDGNKDLKSVTTALKEANQALALPLERRVSVFGFLQRYRAKIKITRKPKAPTTLLKNKKKRRKNDNLAAAYSSHYSSDSDDDDDARKFHKNNNNYKNNNNNSTKNAPQRGRPSRSREGSFSPILFSQEDSTRRKLQQVLEQATKRTNRTEEKKRMIRERVEEKLSQEIGEEEEEEGEGNVGSTNLAEPEFIGGVDGSMEENGRSEMTTTTDVRRAEISSAEPSVALAAVTTMKKKRSRKTHRGLGVASTDSTPRGTPLGTPMGTPGGTPEKTGCV